MQVPRCSPAHVRTNNLVQLRSNVRCKAVLDTNVVHLVQRELTIEGEVPGSGDLRDRQGRAFNCASAFEPYCCMQLGGYSTQVEPSVVSFWGGGRGGGDLAANTCFVHMQAANHNAVHTITDVTVRPCAPRHLSQPVHAAWPGTECQPKAGAAHFRRLAKRQHHPNMPARGLYEYDSVTCLLERQDGA